MAEKNLIKIYVNATSAKRVDIIIRHYTDFMGIVDGYTEGLRYMIECEKESNSRQDVGDLGVRVQTGGMTSDPTAKKAIRNVLTREALINCDFSGDVMDGVDRADEYMRDAYLLRDMRKDYELFRRQLCILGTEKETFEKYLCANQDIYRKVTHIPTAEELEKDYICLQDAADLLGISREKLAKIARSEEIGRLLDSTICNNKRWITRKSFQLFLNAQNVYHITDDEDKKKESRGLQEKETLSLMVKEYISRQDAAELAGVNVSTVTKWMQSGEFQCIGAGKVLRVHRQQFLKWLEKNREGVM